VYKKPQFINSSPITISGTSYTLAISDANTFLFCDNSSALVIGIPSSAIATFDINDNITFLRRGTGTVTLSALAGVTMYSSLSASQLFQQYSLATVIQTSINSWVLGGDVV